MGHSNTLTVLYLYPAGDERVLHHQEELEAEEPILPPSGQHVTVGNLLVMHSCIKQHNTIT